MMTCHHNQEPFGYHPFGKNDEPVEMEIRIFKLWRCSDCGLWYSFIGVTEGFRR